jgi:hypothetical protein
VETQLHTGSSAEIESEPDGEVSAVEQQAAHGDQAAPIAEAVAVAEPTTNVSGEHGAVTEAKPIVRETTAEATVSQDQEAAIVTDAHAQAPATHEAEQEEGQPPAAVEDGSAGPETIKTDEPAGETTTTTVPVMAVHPYAAATQDVVPQVGAPSQAPAFTRLFAISPLLTGLRSGQAGKHAQARAATDPAGPLPEGPIDLVLPETTDRMTTEVLSAVLRQQPGITVGQLTRRGGSLYLPVNLSRPVPLGAILREFPRISTVTYVEGTEQQVRQLAVQLR